MDDLENFGSADVDHWFLALLIIIFLLAIVGAIALGIWGAEFFKYVWN